MQSIDHFLLSLTNSKSIPEKEHVQSLWSGYGSIDRYKLEGGKYPSVIIKHIKEPNDSKHPKGWDTNHSNKRKLRSYEVESNWYKSYAQITNDCCKVPQLFHAINNGAERVLIMEDLNSSGYPKRHSPESIDIKLVRNCIVWIANFHAVFMGYNNEGLWEQGCYWHLDTRPDELAKMKDLELQKAAPLIDAHLRSAKYQTLVHGDAKLANFCFSERGDVAAVDFQYVGKGCGMKDLAYFISSCFDGKECERHADELLDFYFKELSTLLDRSINFQELKEEWSKLYAFAWADFYRFLDGWSPGHWKVHSYSKKQRDKVLKMINEA